MLPNDPILYVTDEKLQTAEWANLAVQRYRLYWRPVIGDVYYKRMMAMLLSCQDLTSTLGKYFDDEEFLKNNPLIPLPLMEKPRNIIIDQAREAGIKPYIEAVDPSATADKEQDKFRIRNMQKHIAQSNKIRQDVGLPDNYGFNKKEFNGNVEEFEKMGLNPAEESEVKFFFDTHYKLNYEIEAQKAVLSLLTACKAEDDIPRFGNDTLAVKCICKQTFVSATTGQTLTRYLQPNQTYAIFGNARDASDAAVKGWERGITVQELISNLGRAFSFEKNWLDLLNAINYCNGTDFNGFIRGDSFWSTINFNISGVLDTATAISVDTPARKFLDFDDLSNGTYNYKVYFGYIEWPQLCLHVEKRNRNTGQRFTVGNDFIPTERSQYEREEREYFKTKQSFYLATGGNSQKLFGYGDLYFMPTKGDCDEYSGGSITIIREEGLSATGIAEIYIKLANYAYYKMLWTIHRSKPDQWDYSFESIRDIAQKWVQPLNKQGTNTPQVPGTFGSAVDKLVEKMEKKLVKFHTNPNIDGQPVGGGGSGHIKIPGTLDALAIELREAVLEWAEHQIADKLGLAGIANAQAPNPRDGLKLNELYLRQSRAATGYIPRMLDKSYRNTADVMLQYIQDILRFPQSLAYKFLRRLVGEDCVEILGTIREAVPRRYAITATSYSNWPDKKEQLGEALMAFQKGLITFSEYQLLKLIDDPRTAAKQSAFFQEKGEKRKEAQQKAQNDFLMAMRDKNEAGTFKLEEMKGDKKILAERIRTNGYIYQADKMAESKTDAANIQAGATVNKDETKLENDKEILQDKSTIELQKSLLKDS